MNRIVRLAALALIVAGLTAGCVYRMNIQQGNYLDPNAVAQLKEGMTRSQVRYLLGTPMVPDAFNESRWDYLYFLKRGRIKAPEKRRLSIWFEDDKVARVEKVNVAAPVEVPTTPAPTPAATPAAPVAEPQA
ncbi:MAG: outer membrane protein assembly factor BamE [Steroidobacteraceae bacterium]